MTDPLFLAASELPPKPDPTTGDPRPPQAPGFNQKQRSDKQQNRRRVTDPAKAPSPPEGEGPTLSWFKSSRWDALLVAAWAIPVLPVLVTALQGFSIEWMKYWQPWVVIPVVMLIVYGVQRSVECAVGAEWLKVGKTWVRLYELAEIKAKHRSNAIHLDFKDRAGREVMVKSDDIQMDREMWDLIYNGILHSAIAGNAETNSLVHSSFKVPRPENWQG